MKTYFYLTFERRYRKHNGPGRIWLKGSGDLRTLAAAEKEYAAKKKQPKKYRNVRIKRFGVRRIWSATI